MHRNGFVRIAWAFAAWALLDLGIKIYPKALQRDVLRNRVFAGETVSYTRTVTGR